MRVISNQGRVEAEQAKGQINLISATAQLTVNQLVTHVTNTTGTAVVVTLPPVAEAAGKIYAIYTVDGTGNGVDVVDKGDALYSDTEGSTSVDVSSAVAIDTAGDFLCMYSTGFSWICFGFKIA